MRDILLSSHFSMSELTTTSQGLDNKPDAAQTAALVALCVRALEPIRALLGVPLQVTSGFRSAAVNKAIKGAAKSQHLLGEAADVVPVGYPGGAEAAMQAIAAEVKKGTILLDQVIVYPLGGFLHVSYTERRANRCELLRSEAAGGSGGPYHPWTGPTGY